MTKEKIESFFRGVARGANIHPPTPYSGAMYILKNQHKVTEDIIRLAKEYLSATSSRL